MLMVAPSNSPSHESKVIVLENMLFDKSVDVVHNSIPAIGKHAQEFRFRLQSASFLHFRSHVSDLVGELVHHLQVQEPLGMLLGMGIRHILRTVSK